MPVLVDDRPQDESVRSILRRETRKEHAQLDGHPAFAALLDGKLDLEGYRRLMLAFHGLYGQLDAQLRDACDLHSVDRFGFDYAPRTPLLEADLYSLGLDPRAAGWLSAGAAPQANSTWSLGGMLYVVEGSVLGGSMMYKATEILLARSGASGNAYWGWCRQVGASRWAMTCRLLQDLATSEAARAEMISGAKTAFSYFVLWLDCRQDVTRSESLAPC